MPGAIIGVYNLRQVVSPSFLLLFSKGSEHLEQGPVESFRWITLRMVGCGPGITNSTELLQGLEEFIFKFATKVMVQFKRVRESWNEVLEEFLCSSLSGFISGGVGLSVPCKMVHNDQNVFKASLACLQVKVVDGN